MKDENKTEAVEQLQQLGFKEYEAEALVAVVSLGSATAKDVSEISEVPRTRVYDAIRVLEARGLVEVQHGTPQRFRSTSVMEAVDTLEQEFENRFESLERHLAELDGATGPDPFDVHEVWSLRNTTAIGTRTRSLIEDADEEVVVVFGVPDVVTEGVLESLREAVERDLDVLVGAVGEDIKTTVEEGVKGATVFTSGLDWLEPTDQDSETAIGRLMLVDERSVLVSSFDVTNDEEQAVFGSGFKNGFVVVARRLLTTGLLAGERSNER